MRDADWRTLTAALFSFLGVMTLLLLAWSLRRLARPDPVQNAWRAFCQKLAAARRRARARTRARATTPRAPRAPSPPRARASCASARCTSALRYGAQPSADGAHAPAQNGARALIRVFSPAAALPRPLAWASYAERPEVQAFVRDLVEAPRLRRERAQARIRESEARRPGARGDQPAGRARAHLGGIPHRAAHRAARRRGPRVLEEVPPHAGARREEVRRAAGVRRGDHRRRDLLRPQHRQLARGRCAHHARLRLSAARGLLPQRARAIPAVRARRRHRRVLGARLVRRRHRPAAVHAEQHARLRGRFRRQRAHRPAEEPRRRHRQRGQLPQGARLAARRRRAARRARRRRRLAAVRRRLEPKHSHAGAARGRHRSSIRRSPPARRWC